MSLTVGNDQNLDSLGPAVRDALCLRAGVNIEKPHRRAREFTGRRLTETIKEYLYHLGVADARSMSSTTAAKLVFNQMELYRRLGAIPSHSTADFDNILATTIGKSLQQAYQAYPATWPLWCGKMTVPDFKQQSVTQLSSAPDLAAIKEGGEYTFGTFSDKKQQFTLAKYGKAISFSWESIINDDLSAFDRVPKGMAQTARRLEEVTLYSTVFAANSGEGQTMGEDSINLFKSGHANVGSTATLSVASLAQTGGLMRVQKALGGNDYLNLKPRFLLAPPALEATALQLTASMVDPALANATPNPFNNQLTTVIVPYLADVDSNGWWLVADSNQIDTAVMAFLDGEEEPVVESENTFAIDGRRFKVRHTIAAAAIDYRGFCKNAGGS